MTNDRSRIRGTLVVEDRRTEMFFRELLERLGFDKRRFTFKIAPSGRGDAGDWVRAQYPSEVLLIRQKRHQRLCLIAVRDGDNDGLDRRKADLDSALVTQGLNPRQVEEHIATPVPTWSIETWLLALLGNNAIDESESVKRVYERSYPEGQQRQSIRDAARAWRTRIGSVPTLPSLADGDAELSRL
jgi:hypothetical protein